MSGLIFVFSKGPITKAKNGMPGVVCWAWLEKSQLHTWLLITMHCTPHHTTHPNMESKQNKTTSIR